MLFKALILTTFNIYISNAALFLWSNHELKISPLQEFTTKDFLNVVDKLQKKPDVYIFRSTGSISTSIKPIVKGFYSMYNPNGNLEYDNIIDLTGNSEKDFTIIKETIGNSNNFLSTIIITNDDSNRAKRNVESPEDSDEDMPDSDLEPTIKEPVIYKTFKMTKNHEKMYALMYSSTSLVFRANDSEPLFLGNVDDDMIIYDTRLNINYPHGRGKISLRFNFNWQSGYWYMPSVRIKDTESTIDFNLVTKDQIGAPARFSYHCNGETKFVNDKYELIIYDLQVQPDSRNGKFGDASDCVPFTTAPICSGIFVTMILGIGLVIALIAIMDIKTMDKFDNYKTKNLTITVID